MTSLYDSLHRPSPTQPSPAPSSLSEEPLDAREFCLRVVRSPEFRTYITNGIVLGDLPPAILCRILDYAWGAPLKRVEVVGRDGGPIETISRIERVIVDARNGLDELPIRDVAH